MNNFLKKVIAQSPDDLQIISAICAESKVKISDIKYLPSTKIFLLSVLRIDKETDSSKPINSVIKFEFIESSKSKNINQSNVDFTFELLAIDIFNRDQISFNPSSSKIQANFDRTQLIRVITNLLKNAFQAIPEDRNPEIDVNIYEKDNEVNISISDNGYGISKMDMEKIFEPSFTTKSSGMGLGLSMIKSIITAYNGSISFTSKSNVGTTFNITFPKK